MTKTMIRVMLCLPLVAMLGACGAAPRTSAAMAVRPTVLRPQTTPMASAPTYEEPGLSPEAVAAANREQAKRTSGESLAKLDRSPKDAKLSFEEFAGARPTAELRAQFTRSDRDGDRHLDRAELELMLLGVLQTFRLN